MSDAGFGMRNALDQGLPALDRLIKDAERRGAINHEFLNQLADIVREILAREIRAEGYLGHFLILFRDHLRTIAPPEDWLAMAELAADDLVRSPECYNATQASMLISGLWAFRLRDEAALRTAGDVIDRAPLNHDGLLCRSHFLETSARLGHWERKRHYRMAFEAIEAGASKVRSARLASGLMDIAWSFLYAHPNSASQLVRPLLATRNMSLFPRAWRRLHQIALVSGVRLSPEQQQKAAEAIAEFARERRKKRASHFQYSVGAILRSLGVSFFPEEPVEGLRVDYLIAEPKPDLALECDGPLHRLYDRNTRTRIATGEDATRNRILTSAGYRIDRLSNEDPGWQADPRRYVEEHLERMQVEPGKRERQQNAPADLHSF